MFLHPSADSLLFFFHHHLHFSRHSQLIMADHRSLPLLLFFLCLISRKKSSAVHPSASDLFSFFPSYFSSCPKFCLTKDSKKQSSSSTDAIFHFPLLSSTLFLFHLSPSTHCLFYFSLSHNIKHFSLVKFWRNLNIIRNQARPKSISVSIQTKYLEY